MMKISNFKGENIGIKEPYNRYMVGMKIIPSKSLEDDEIIPYPIECLCTGTMLRGFYVSLKLYEKIKHLEKKEENGK